MCCPAPVHAVLLPSQRYSQTIAPLPFLALPWQTMDGSAIPAVAYPILAHGQLSHAHTACDGQTGCAHEAISARKHSCFPHPLMGAQLCTVPLRCSLP